MDPPRDLTIPEPGSTTARGILSLALGRALRELASVRRHAPPSAHREAATIETLVKSAPRGAIVSALRRPTVSAPLRCLRGASPAARDGLLVEIAGQLAFDLALSDALPEPVRLRRWPACLLSIPARLAIEPPERDGELVIENGRVLAIEGAHVEAFHAIDGSIALALRDNNPLALVDAHPDKSGNAIDLGERDASTWVTELRAALDPIARHLPDLRAEMDLLLAQIVPVGWDAERHLSASYQEAIGTIYMTLHPGRMTLTEALIHELSHNKLNALFELDDVLENAWSPLYASPVRPDPRPLHGVLLAVHAFLPVARLYEAMIEANDPLARPEGFRRRYDAIRAINREGAAVLLEHARPTTIGAGLLAEIRRWDDHFRAL